MADKGSCKDLMFFSSKKHEIYVATFGGHVFYDLFIQGRGECLPVLTLKSDQNKPYFVNHCYRLGEKTRLKLFRCQFLISLEVTFIAGYFLLSSQNENDMKMKILTVV